MSEQGITNLNSLFQIVANISGSIAVLVSVLIFTYQKKRELKIQAIKAGMNIEQIVVQWSYVDMVIKSSFPAEYDMITRKDPSSMVKFEKDEIVSVYSKQELNIIKKMYLTNKFNGVLIGPPSLIFKVNRDAIESANNRYPKLVSEIVGESSNQEYIHIFHRILIDTLNKIETISAMINLNIADENTVYSLLGTSFCGFIKMMHYYICFTNQKSNVGDKKLFYTISLYNKWKKRSLKNRLKTNKRNHCD